MGWGWGCAIQHEKKLEFDVFGNGKLVGRGRGRVQQGQGRLNGREWDGESFDEM